MINTTAHHASDDTYYTPQTLAGRWGCSTDIVYDLLRKGKLKGFKLGRDWRITDEARLDYERNPDNSKATVYAERGRPKHKNNRTWNRVV